MSATKAATQPHRADVRTLNVGLVGGGEIAKLHAAAYALVPIYFDPPPAIPIRRILCDVSEERASAGAQRLGFDEWVTSYEDLVRRDEVDIVDITVPNGLHAEVAVAAAEHGKMIVCEKPMSTDLAGARRMYEAASRAGVRTAVTFQKRRFPAVAHARNLVQSGAIGDLTLYHGAYRQAFGLLPLPPGNWRGSPSQVGSLLGEVGSHAIDMARFIVGEFESVSAAGDGQDIASTVVWIANLAGGVLGTFEFCGVASNEGDGIGFELYGTKGAIKWHSQHAQVLQVASEETPMAERGFRTIRMNASHPFGHVWGLLSQEGMVDSKAYEVHDMLEAFVNDTPYAPDFHDGLRAAEVVDALLRSVQTRQWVDVPAVSR